MNGVSIAEITTTKQKQLKAWKHAHKRNIVVTGQIRLKHEPLPPTTDEHSVMSFLPSMVASVHAVVKLNSPF